MDRVRGDDSHGASCKSAKELLLRLSGPTDCLYELAGATLWKDWGEALLTVQNEEGKQPHNADVRLIHAHLLRMAEDWITAGGEATEAVALAPESPFAHALGSTICYHSGLTECAVRDAMVFVKNPPRDGAAYIVLGHARELQGDDGEALRAYREAKRLHPGYSEIYEGVGGTYARSGEFEKAVGAFEEAIRIDGNRSEYYGELGQIYLSEGYTRKAVERLKHAKELDPERPEILLAFGKCLPRGRALPRGNQGASRVAGESAGIGDSTFANGEGTTRGRAPSRSRSGIVEFRTVRRRSGGSRE